MFKEWEKEIEPLKDDQVDIKLEAKGVLTRSENTADELPSAVSNTTLLARQGK